MAQGEAPTVAAASPYAAGGYAAGGVPVAGFQAEGVAAASGPDASGTMAANEALSLSDVFEGLAAFQSLARERALSTLRQAVNAGRFEPDAVEGLTLSALKAESWEARQGALLAGAEAIRAWDRPAFRKQILPEVPRMLLDKEYRVRKAVAGVLRECCRRDGLATYDVLGSLVLKNVRETFERAPDSSEVDMEEIKLSGASAVPEAPPVPPPPPTFLPDTEGWRTLETSMGALEAMMQGCGEAFSPRIDDHLLGLLADCSRHTNRFVREYAFFAYKDVITVCTQQMFLSVVADKTFEVIHKGILDNWSQVRYAGSVAARAFMEKAGSDKERFYPELLGCMCLNRHYVAEGVRNYSQETWRNMVGPQGGARLLVAHFDNVIEEYKQAAEAPNHAVREAACHCICELGSRVAGTPAAPSPFREYFTSPRIQILMDILVAAFSDESWPVRDVASTAIGHFVVSFPEECSPFRGQLLEMWFDQIQDNIPSLRKNGAVALSLAVSVWSDALWTEVLARLTELLPAVEFQPENSQVFADYTPSGPFSVPRPKAMTLEEHKQSSDTAHTNQVMYSCGSLAPKTIKRRIIGSGGGCMNCNVEGGHQPWEASEGMAHLLIDLVELSAKGAIGEPEPRLDQLATLVPLLVRAFSCKHYLHSHLMRQRLCERLPALIQSLRPHRVVAELPKVIQQIMDCVNQKSYLALHEVGRVAILSLKDGLSPSEKDDVAKQLSIDGSLDTWINKAARA